MLVEIFCQQQDLVYNKNSSITQTTFVKCEQIDETFKKNVKCAIENVAAFNQYTVVSIKSDWKIIDGHVKIVFVMSGKN